MSACVRERHTCGEDSGMTVAGSEEGVWAIATVLAVVVLVVGGVTVSAVTMLCCWKRQQQGCKGERESTELGPQHQPWYLQQETPVVGARQDLFHATGGHPLQSFHPKTGQVQYVADYVQQQHTMQDEYVRQQREEGEEEDEEEEEEGEGEQFQLESEEGVGRCRAAGGPGKCVGF